MQAVVESHRIPLHALLEVEVLHSLLPIDRDEVGKSDVVRRDEEERATFMEEFGLAESGLHKLIHAGFDLLGLTTFFTAGEKEVRAWVIHKGDTAPVAAGAIHTDFEKKFIRSETYSFDDLMEHESEAAIKAAGKLRVEGKDYVMQDGDISHFLIG